MDGKIILEFNGIEQEKEAKMAMDGSKWCFAFNNVFEKVRNAEKHLSDPVLYTPADVMELLNEAKRYWNLPDEY
jgi:hypothetical protein